MSTSSLLTLGAVISTVAAAAVGHEDLHHRQGSSCKVLPGDAAWPSANTWAQLNSTVGGRLIATHQVANVCHGSEYNATACATLKAEWDLPEPHLYTAGEFDNPYFQNQSCNPYTPQSQPCVLGNYASYSINVNSAADVQAGFAFAQKNNVRLVVKNTGHDYLGKSTGKGSLAFWTFNMKSYKIIPNYSGPTYSGPAMKIGAGMMGAEAYTAAHASGYRLVGGDCPSVGIAGGYSQGGGHSPLASYHGLAADQVLEWEVVTPTGQHLIATPKQNSDLYWALSGGGGGTYGVVLSMTSKAHPDGPVGGAFLQVSSSSQPATTNDNVWAAIDVFHAALPKLTDNGITFTYQISNDTFSMYTATAPNQTAAAVTAQLSPLISWLNTTGVPYIFVPSQFDNYYEHAEHYFGPFPTGVFPVSQVTAGRFVNRATVSNANSNAALGKTLRSITADGHFQLTMTGLNAARANPNVAGTNAVQPAWRDTVITMMIAGPWDWTIPNSEMVARQDLLTNTIVPELNALNPNAGTYLNEADFQMPNWQQQFYGPNYARLSAIKAKYDPLGLMYAQTAVGSEAWTQDASGRLCRSHSGHKYP